MENQLENLGTIKGGRRDPLSLVEFLISSE